MRAYDIDKGNTEVAKDDQAVTIVFTSWNVLGDQRAGIQIACHGPDRNREDGFSSRWESAARVLQMFSLAPAAASSYTRFCGWGSGSAGPGPLPSAAPRAVTSFAQLEPRGGGLPALRATAPALRQREQRRAASNPRRSSQVGPFTSV